MLIDLATSARAGEEARLVSGIFIDGLPRWRNLLAKSMINTATVLGCDSLGSTVLLCHHAWLLQILVSSSSSAVSTAATQWQ
jgi:hypothetical protein